MPDYKRTARARSRRKRHKMAISVLSKALVVLVSAAAAGGLAAGCFLGMKAWREGTKVSIVTEKKREVIRESFPKSGQNGGNVSGSDLTPDERARKALEQLTLEEKVAQLFIITPEALTGYETVTAAGNATKEAYEAYPVGGLVYFSGNLISENKVKDMLFNTKRYAMDRIGVPVFTGIDEEGGSVARIGNHPDFSVPKVSDASLIGASRDPKKAYEAGKTIGSYLVNLGFNLDFAPVADVYSNPKNTVIAKRSFGKEGTAVAAFSNEMMRGLKEQGVNAALKHFPGHGGTEGDTHDGYAFTEKSLEELLSDDLVPFQKGIEAGADFVMVAHIAVPAVTGNDTPATMSSVLLTDVLREQLGFDKIIVTDALNMNAVVQHYSPEAAAVKALQAGADMLLMPADFKKAYQGVLNAVKQGTLTKERIDESVYRILEVKFRTLP